MAASETLTPKPRTILSKTAIQFGVAFCVLLTGVLLIAWGIKSTHDLTITRTLVEQQLKPLIEQNERNIKDLEQRAVEYATLVRVVRDLHDMTTRVAVDTIVLSQRVREIEDRLAIQPAGQAYRRHK